MAKLYFKVSSDVDKVIQLRQEITKLRQELMSMDVNKAPAAAKSLQTQIGVATQEFTKLTTEAAKAGAVMENDFKTKIYQGSQAVNTLTEDIIKQKAIIRETKDAVRTLGEKYAKMSKFTPVSSSTLSELNNAKSALSEQKYSLGELQTEQSNARLSVKKLRDEYALYKDDAKGVADANGGMSLSLGKVLGVIGGAAAIKQLGSEVMRVRGEFRQMESSLNTMLGADKAKNLLDEVKKYAAVSPLELKDVSAAAQMMVGFNIEAEKTPQFIRAIGDVTQGNSQKFNSMTLAFSQCSAAGKLMGQDLNQMINAGFNPLTAMSEKTGKSIAQLKEEMSKGAISAEMVQQTFIDATSAGGKFFNMSENASKEMSGQMSMLYDSIDNALNKIGENNEGVIIDGIQLTTELVENYEAVGKVLVGLIGTYGLYRTAVMLAVAAENGHSISTMILRGRVLLTQKAQALLNITMLKNPYVAVAVAVGTLATAMWAMHDSMSAAEKAQKEYTKAKEETIKKEGEHKQEIDSLLSSARDESLATLTRQKSLEELIKEYPKIFEKYDLEKLKLADILNLKRQINEEDSTRSVGERKDEYDSLKEITSRQQRYLQLFDNPSLRKNMSEKDMDIWKMFAGKQSYVQVREEMKKNKEKLKLAQNDALNDSLSSYKVNLKNYSKEKIEAELKTAQSSASKRNGFNVGGMMVKGVELEGVISSLNGALSEKKAPATYKEDLAKSKSEWEAAKKSLSEIEKDKDKFTSKQYEEAKKRAETTEKSYKDLGGVTGSSLTKQESATDKLRKEQAKYALLLDKQSREQKRMEEDSANELEQLEIDRLKDGSEKVLMQRAFNHKKELEAIEREAQDKKAKAIEEGRAAHEANPDEKKKPFNAEEFIKSEPVKKQFATFDNVAEAKTKTANTQYNRGDDLSGLLNEYQDYTDKRLAIETKFNNDLAVLDEQRKQAVKNGDIQQVEQIDRAKAQAEKNKKEDLSNVSIDEFKTDIDWATLFGNLDVLSPDSLNKLRDKLKKFIEAAADKLTPEDLKVLSEAMTNVDLTIADKTPYEALKTGISGYKDATNEAAAAQDKLNKLQRDGKEGTKEYEDATKELTNAQKNRQESLKTMTQAVNNIGEKGQAVVTAGSDITDMLTSLGISIPESLSGALNGIGQVMDSMASVDLMKPMSILTGITGTLAGIGKTIGSIFGGSSDGTKVYEDMKEQLSSINEIYEKIIANSKEDIVFGAGFSSVQAANDALDTYYKKVENYRRLADAAGGAGSSAGSHSYAYRTNKSLSGDWESISRLIGKNISGIQDMYNLTGEQLYLIQTKMPDSWNKISSDIKDNLNAIIACKDEASELADALNAAMTGVDTDSFYNGFIDSLSDMDTSFEDMCDNFEGYLRKSIVAGLVASQYQGRIDSLYTKWSDAAVSDKKITEEESKALQDEYQQIVKDMMKNREDMAKSFGWTSSESTSQDSTKGMSQSMSQDTGDELNGRFTALQIAGEEIKNQSILQSQSLNLLTFKADAILSVNTEVRNIADETRTILANSYLELVQISENTGESAKYLKDIKSDIADVKRNTSRI